MDGFLIVSKPSSMTSHDMVNKTRRKLSTKKVGHTGTLDPMATGVLVLCIGRGTRFAEYLVGGKKTYEAEITFGISTDTLDMDGEILSEESSSHIKTEDIKSALESFKGNIMQVPPMVSAIKQNGVPLYKLARKGIEVHREARPVTIHEIDLLSSEIVEDKRIISIRVTCSAGTYIRSLCGDLGEKLAINAVLSKLHRSQNGIFSDKDALSYEDFTELSPEEVSEKILPLETACNYLPFIDFDGSKADDISCGREIFLTEAELEEIRENVEDDFSSEAIVENASIGAEFSCLALINSKAAAIGIIKDNIFKPKKVFL